MKGSNMALEETQVSRVVSLLPTRSVALLDTADEPLKSYIIASIGSVFDHWEKEHLLLDPIQVEPVLDSLVYTLYMTSQMYSEHINDLNNMISSLTQVVETATQLLENKMEPAPDASFVQSEPIMQVRNRKNKTISYLDFFNKIDKTNASHVF